MINKKVIRRFNFVGAVLLSFLIAVRFLLPAPVFACDRPGIDEKSQEPYARENSNGRSEEDEKKKKDEEEKLWRKNCDDIIKFLKERKDDLYPVNFGVDVSFNGHKAGENNLYKLNIGANFVSYQYPGEFCFRAATALQFRNNMVQEDVTTLLVKYDYYFEPWFEMYGFVERFSDSFLSIQHRYEIGGGVKFELNLWGKKREKEREIERYRAQLKEVFKQNEIKDCTPTAASIKHCHEKQAPSNYDSSKKADELLKEEHYFYDLLKRKFAKVSASLVITILSELEKAEIETYIDDRVAGEGGETIICEGTATARFPLEGEQRSRIVVRPKVIINLLENFSLTGLIYLKYPLGKPQKVLGRIDYRYDALLRAELKMSNPFNWAKKVALFFEYQRHYDNYPPRLPDSIIDEYRSTGKELRKTIADDTHEEFLFGLNIQF